MAGPEREDDDEDVEVRRSAGRLHSALGRGRHVDRRGLPQGWDIRSDLLQLAQEVWRAAAAGEKAPYATRG